MTLQWLFLTLLSLNGLVSSSPVGPVERASADDIVFQLFTADNPTTFQALKLGDVDALQQSNFDPALPTKFFAHGWNADATSGYSTRNQYLNREKVNFISIDWKTLASGINYPFIALVNVPIAGEHVGAFIDFLISQGAPIESIHLIGFSLGAHVVGKAGASVTAGQLPRITGCDPAGPGFPLNDTDARLDTSDAIFVDIIQTNSGDLINNGLGFGPAIGHIDFYPNGGEFQPGCKMSRFIETYFPRWFRATMDRGGCDHGRSVSYFAESINSAVGFFGTECDSYDEYLNDQCTGNAQMIMGDMTPSTARGIYYLTTNSASPYAQGSGKE